MKKNTSHALVRIIVIAALLVLVVAAAIQCANGKSLAETAWSLLPPVIAIVLALLTKEVYSTLFVGILIFLVILGAMVSLMIRAGGSAAFGRGAA